MENEEQAEYWNGPAAEGWVRRVDAVDAIFAGLTREALAAAAFRPGERVLDLGCGCGTTALEIARRVAPHGRADGFDLSRRMVVHARRRARDAGQRNVRFETADVQTAPLGAGADAAFSRFGLMFFQDPGAAFANILAALGAGGRLHFIAWAAPEENPMFSGVMGEAARRLGLPPAEPGKPGPFGLCDPGRTRLLLERAGFEEVQIDKWRPVVRHGSAREALEVLSDLSGTLGPRIAALGAGAREELAKAVEANLAPYTSAAGVEIPVGVWSVTAWRVLDAA